MSKGKQIEEMARLMCANYDGERGLCGDGLECNHDCWAYREATHLYNAGYRKQSEMEWLFDDGMDRYCSNCGANALTSCFEPKQICTPYCPMCGAKMKGGAE